MGNHFYCRDGDPCTINCGTENRDNLCRGSKFKCPIDNECTINCGLGNTGNGSCRDTNIECPIDGNCYINCEGGASDTCTGSTIKCPKNGNCTINCSNGDNQCKDLQIQCPENGFCTFICQHTKGNTDNVCGGLYIDVNGAKYTCIGSHCPSLYSAASVGCVYIFLSITFVHNMHFF